ncbi:MAG TPA: M48 family metalloprotease [Terriglobia bacterium]|nr:M48 family metalloprotease [Terriglobia bacterium]
MSVLRKSIVSYGIFVLALAQMALARQQSATDPPDQPTRTPQVQPGYSPQDGETQVQAPFSSNAGESAELTRIVNSFIARENQLVKNLRNYTPRVETYIQDMRPDPELGAVPVHDHYYLERLDFKKGFDVHSLLPGPDGGSRLAKDLGSDFSRLYSLHYEPGAFAYPIVMDMSRFNRQHYNFEFVRREFLGDIRCLVFDVKPKPHAGVGRFGGRIWVEDQDYNVVRFNGTYAPAPRMSSYFHFDSWRENLQPGLWLPVYVYSEESDLKYSVGRTLRFRSQTRLWGYALSNPNHQSELTRVLVDSPNSVHDASQTSTDSSPVASEREWQREATQNVLDRLTKAGLLAPPGDVDKVLETVVNNLIVSNNIQNAPEVHCRVLLTTPVESLAIGDTIILSRGLIDVLPDEASLAAMLAHELAHILLQHTFNIDSTKWAFEDRLLISDEQLLKTLDFHPSEHDEEAADTKALDLLKNSPYKDQLGKAGLFLRAMADTAPHTPQLFGPHLGSRLVQGDHVRRLADLMAKAPQIEKTRLDQIAALPLGSRVKVDAWSDAVELVKSKGIALVSAREKMPFEVTPLFPYLTRFGSSEEAADQPKSGEVRRPSVTQLAPPRASN